MLMLGTYGLYSLFTVPMNFLLSDFINVVVSNWPPGPPAVPSLFIVTLTFPAATKFGVLYDGRILTSSLVVPPIWAIASSVSLTPAFLFDSIILPRISGSQY